MRCQLNYYVIDPRALQQHFQKVHQREQPKKPEVPRVPDLEPLTAIQAIPLPIKVTPTTLIQEEYIDQIPKTVIEKELVNLLINVPKPIDKIIINEIEEDVIESNKKSIQNLETSQSIEEYDPYGYYSGPKF